MAIVSSRHKGRVLAYIGPRKDGFKQIFKPSWITARRSLNEQYAVVI